MPFYDTKMSHFLSSYSSSINITYMNSELRATLRPRNVSGFHSGCFLSDNFFRVLFTAYRALFVLIFLVNYCLHSH